MIACLSMAGCISPRPFVEHTLADTALRSAREAGAGRLAPVPFHEAEVEYKRGERAFAERDNDLARSSFVRAKDKAEEAENAARLKRFQSGETVP